MVYDLSNPLHQEGFKIRCNALYSRQAVVEIKEKKPRSLSQNAYLHSALSYFGLQTGYSLDEVKRWFYKETANPGLFVRQFKDSITGTVRFRLRSSSDLTAEEMTLSISRFRDWAAQTAGVYIPSPDEHRLVFLMECEAKRNPTFP